MAVIKKRLDVLLVEKGLVPSRQRAAALILAGQVFVGEQTVTKAGQLVPVDAPLRLAEPDHPFVSRGGLKLQGALEAFSLDVTGLAAIDVGASTGGFTDCLLQRGARHVIALDVGYGQLDWKLRQDSRVTCIERCNAREINLAALRAQVTSPNAFPLDLAVIDVSFISLNLVLGAVASVLGPQRDIVALIKPQFEAGRADVGKGGVVRDPEKRLAAVARVLDWVKSKGFTVLATVDSPITGPKGNLECLAHFKTPRDIGPAAE